MKIVNLRGHSLHVGMPQAFVRVHNGENVQPNTQALEPQDFLKDKGLG